MTFNTSPPGGTCSQIPSRWPFNFLKNFKNSSHYASVDALHLLGDLRQPLDDRRRVNFAQNGVVAGLALRLRHQVLPAGVATEQVPLVPPVKEKFKNFIH